MGLLPTESGLPPRRGRGGGDGQLRTAPRRAARIPPAQLRQELSRESSTDSVKEATGQTPADKSVLDATPGSRLEQRNSLLKHLISPKRGGRGEKTPVRSADRLCDTGQRVRHFPVPLQENKG